MRQLVFPLTFLGIFGIASSEAQTIQLRQAGTGNSRVQAVVGDIVEIEIFVDMKQVSAAAIYLFLSVPGNAFQVKDNGALEEVGTQPFLPGSLFDTEPVVNLLLSETDDDVGMSFPGRQLDFWAFLSKPADSQAESGVLASFSLYAASPIENGQVVIDSNPVRDSRLRGEDLFTDIRFKTVKRMEITVVNPATSVDPSTWGELKRRL